MFNSKEWSKVYGKVYKYVLVEINTDSYYRVNLPRGSIKKLIVRELSWNDEPVELKEDWYGRIITAARHRPNSNVVKGY